MANNMERWFANRTGEEAPAPETPETRIERLQKLGDEHLTEMLQHWTNIRTSQETGSGVRDDVVQLDLLFGQINKRLGELGQLQFKRQEDLP